MKRCRNALLYLLIAALLLPLFSACSQKNPETGSEPAAANTPVPEEVLSEEPPAEEEEGPVLAFDKQDYGGVVFHILTCSEADYEYNAEEETGERVNDAIFARNLNAEDYLNVDLDVIYESGDWNHRDSYNALIRNSIAAGDNAYDYVTGMISCIQPLASTDSFLNLNEMSGMELSNPWWVSSMQEELSLNGKLLSIIGDVSLSLYKGLSVFFFNQNLLADRNLEDPFTLVREGRWTVDKMIELGSDTGSDLNGDGAWNLADDLYGTVIYEVVWRSMNAAVDVHPVHIGADGLPVVDDLDERAISVIEKLTSFLHDHDDVWIKDTTESDLRDVFIAGHALFFLGKLNGMESMGDMEADYGIIPMPKYDESQPDYYTQIATATQIILVPVTTGSADITGHVLETLSFFTWRDVVDEYYENALQSRYSRSEATSEMLDIIRQGAVNGFDYAYSTAIAGDPWVNKIVSDYSFRAIAPASAFKSQKKVWEKAIEKILENYQ
ncbi:MAG: hypothetical protein IK132_13920 [Clostridia bacterium]|nr:hypothetical protein [Clostridia bacterium]